MLSIVAERDDGRNPRGATSREPSGDKRDRQSDDEDARDEPPREQKELIVHRLVRFFGNDLLNPRVDFPNNAASSPRRRANDTSHNAVTGVLLS